MRKREKRDGRRKLMFVTFGKKEAKEPESERGTTTLLLNINMGLIVDGGGEDDDDNKDEDLKNMEEHLKNAAPPILNSANPPFILTTALL